MSSSSESHGTHDLNAPTINLEAGAGDLVKPKGAGDGSLERQYREAAAQLAAVTAERDEALALVNYAEDISKQLDARATAAEARIEQAYKAGFDFAMLTNSEDNDLGAENARLREANRKLHRRLQKAEGVAQSVFDTLQGWVDYFKSTASATPRSRERHLFRWVIVDTKRRAEKAVAVLSQEAPNGER